MYIFFLYFFYLIHLALSDCSNGTIQSPNKNCYKIFTQPSTWYLAETACIQSGGHLASIQDVFTNAYLVGIADEGLNSDDYWLGGTTNFRGGNWSWSDFKSFSYTNWLKGINYGIFEKSGQIDLVFFKNWDQSLFMFGFNNNKND
jgi:hypothetical protein